MQSIYKTSGCFLSLSRQAFVWDGLKAIENRAKHGIGFETACEVFFDQWSAFVDASVPEEQRSAVIGLIRERKLLYVVYATRETNLLRLISARQATASERKIYEDGD